MMNENNTGPNDPGNFAEYKQKEQRSLILTRWLDLFTHRVGVRPSKQAKNSYRLKHDFEVATGIYVDNGTFKGAALDIGFEPVSRDAMNWVFDLVPRIPGHHTRINKWYIDLETNAEDPTVCFMERGEPHEDDYWIPASRLGESDWLKHLCCKTDMGTVASLISFALITQHLANYCDLHRRRYINFYRSRMGWPSIKEAISLIDSGQASDGATPQTDDPTTVPRDILANWPVAFGGGTLRLSAAEIVSMLTREFNGEALLTSFCSAIRKLFPPRMIEGADQFERVPWNVQSVGMHLHHLRRFTVDGRQLKRENGTNGSALWSVQFAPARTAYEILTSKQQTQNGGSPMVELYKDSDRFGIKTSCSDAPEFLTSTSELLAQMIESGKYDGDWEFVLRGWLPQLVEVACKLKGYRADVVEQKLIIAGTGEPSTESLVARGVPGRAPSVIASTGDAPAVSALQ